MRYPHFLKTNAIFSIETFPLGCRAESAGRSPGLTEPRVAEPLSVLPDTAEHWGRAQDCSASALVPKAVEGVEHPKMLHPQ